MKVGVRKDPREVTLNKLYNKYKSSARTRNLEFDLTKRDFICLVTENCNYCGDQPSNLYKHNINGSYYIFYNGIDRKDNNQGYTLDNSVPCCKICNYAKRQLTLEEFQEWINRLINVQKSSSQVQPL